MNASNPARKVLANSLGKGTRVNVDEFLRGKIVLERILNLEMKPLIQIGQLNQLLICLMYPLIPQQQVDSLHHLQQCAEDIA